VLTDQKDQMSSLEKRLIVDRMCDLARNLRVELENQNIDSFGILLDEGWKLKSKVSTKISSGGLDNIYKRAIQCGATGGKLLGAGGGGFFLFYVPTEHQNKFDLTFTGLERLDFSFENDGAKIIYK
jgi:D-glycero-alpha-D-manno-heptose-7-phosphate kinase